MIDFSFDHTQKTNLMIDNNAVQAFFDTILEHGQKNSPHAEKQHYFVVTTDDLYPLLTGPMGISWYDDVIWDQTIDRDDFYVHKSEYLTIITLRKLGENVKSWTFFEQAMHQLLDCGIQKKDSIIAFGGGAVGDMAGFLASILYRGVSLIMMPTTLLSMVDSCFGGKTGINSMNGKNSIGSFYPASFIIGDPAFLRTLPEAEFKSGMGEIIKYGMLSKKSFAPWLLKHFDCIMERRDPVILRQLVQKCLELKYHFVKNDFYDQKNHRAALNLGHTMAHAIEYWAHHDRGRTIPHGIAVLMGLWLEYRLLFADNRASMNIEDMARTDHADHRGMFDPDPDAMLNNDAGYGLLTHFMHKLDIVNYVQDMRLDIDDIEKIIHYLGYDKKNRGSSWRFVFCDENDTIHIVDKTPHDFVGKIRHELGHLKPQ